MTLFSATREIPEDITSVCPSGEIYEVSENLADSPYFNPDIAPTPRSGRRWGVLDFAALWIGMCACIPTYMIASSLIAEGMNWWQAILTITLANTIILIPMILNAHAGTRYGISFPVYCRASFGIRGANIPAVLRALVACGWFGIQTWIGGEALFRIMAVLFPSLGNWPSTFLSISVPQLICFLFFWAINMFVIYMGIESIRILLNIKAPLLIMLGLLLLAWAYFRAHGFGPMLSQPSAFAAGGPKAGQFWLFFPAALTGMIGFWATLSLNIPDFSRYAYSQKSQVIGQILGLPTTMALYSFIGVAVTSATIVIYGQAIWDPIALLTRFTNPVVLVIAMFSLCIATLGTNIAANVVSPANDFSHLAPRFISFRTGGLITGLIGIAIQPWKLIADPSGYIFKWLVAYSALLGAIGGILIVDYCFIRRGRIDLAGLFRQSGPYWYQRGFNFRAIIALVLGIAPCAPGFLGTVGLIHAAPIFMELYNYAWFISLGISGGVYALLMLPGSKQIREPDFSPQRHNDTT
ncbi:MAG TPA: NCS1 family nucleobase:cation symporter-1 [Phycisphaerae bacterium]|nr:NCS1 family nucleobase:cation symporter-1 [Phycisphaerae bacterium]